MKKNLVSIIIPYHRKKKYFQQTILSIKKQTYHKFELIIIYDDSSKLELDFVKKIIKNFRNKTLIVNKSNIGAGLSRNKGIKKSKGQFIAFCDADDIWYPTKLETQITFMKKYNLSFCHSSYNIINGGKKKISQFIVKKKIDYDDLLKSCDIGLSTVVCKRQILKNKSFSNTITKEDYFLWLNLILKTKFFFGIKKKLASWRKLDNSLSSSILQRFKDAFIMYSMHSKKNFVINAYYTLRLSIYALIKKIKIYY
tara:strand:+ start:31 stop:792 length:762 start_codon:yes stop_codon:yes gene_type:complete